MHKKYVEDFIDKTASKWIQSSDFIWDNPEIRFEEKVSSQHLIEVLKDEGFNITENIADIDTAFIAEYGTKGPVVAFLGEYDALSGLSQKQDTFSVDPIIEGGNGHGCGHNLLGVAALSAAVTLQNYIKDNKIEARIRFYGCPAEEGGSGKTFMVKSGAFADVDFALTWHIECVVRIQKTS